MLFRVPALIPLALTQDITAFLTAQRVMRAPMVVSVVVNALNVGLFVPLVVGTASTVLHSR